MTSTKPYLIRAIRDWALDNGLTPQILVDAEVENVDVPRAHVKEGQIILNIHDRAVDGLHMSNEEIVFSARFAGRATPVCVPVEAVMAIFARENSQGIFFQASEPSSKQTEDGAERPKKSDGPARAPNGTSRRISSWCSSSRAARGRCLKYRPRHRM